MIQRETSEGFEAFRRKVSFIGQGMIKMESKKKMKSKKKS